MPRPLPALGLMIALTLTGALAEANAAATTWRGLYPQLVAPWTSYFEVIQRNALAAHRYLNRSQTRTWHPCGMA